MRYLVTKSIVNVIGKIWMPSITAAQTYTLNSFEVENATDEEGNITRKSVENWLNSHAGDFASITDFEADIAVGDKDIVIPWEDEESEVTYNDCMFSEWNYEDEALEST